MRRGLMTASAVIMIILLSSATTTAGADDSARILEIIDNIRRHERRYQTLELQCEVRWAFRGQWQEGEFESYRIVHQDAAFSIKQTRTHRAANSNEAGEQEILTQVTESRVEFDGTGTRLLAPNGKTNYVHRRIDVMPALHPIASDPHSCLGNACRGDLGPSLAEFLTDALSGEAAPRLGRQQRQLRAQYLGEADYEGLTCHRIRVEGHQNIRNHGVLYWDFWIAPERNYLPVRVTHTSANLSESLPCREAYYADLREVAPDLWFPFEIHDIEYDSRELQQQGTQTPLMHRRCEVLEANGDPQHPVEFFRTIDVPAETIAAAIVSATESSTPDDDPPPAGEDGSAWWKQPPVYMFGMILVGIAVMAFRRWQKT